MRPPSCRHRLPLVHEATIVCPARPPAHESTTHETSVRRPPLGREAARGSDPAVLLPLASSPPPAREATTARCPPFSREAIAQPVRPPGDQIRLLHRRIQPPRRKAPPATHRSEAAACPHCGRGEGEGLAKGRGRWRRGQGDVVAGRGEKGRGGNVGWGVGEERNEEAFDEQWWVEKRPVVAGGAVAGDRGEKKVAR
ncbi:hypothetical protein PR202_gb24499 [Eleusine coracana subsp. coracana]|uniref:Uncharacterized protein n=1 Tax=Eleusine coracana subsp. coracana TaxID=191504 RepID=A0AAV5FJ58_ELECO|nr:hypothetical protein PR202_gb24499 [Eleusine coracana subsp. coracana]